YQKDGLSEMFIELHTPGPGILESTQNMKKTPCNRTKIEQDRFHNPSNDSWLYTMTCRMAPWDFPKKNKSRPEVRDLRLGRVYTMSRIVHLY
ncbi:hypothetical protein HAX54_002095, partial [Datura stramonium]|nr:hypothetical protein [Datura stramonium]